MKFALAIHGSRGDVEPFAAVGLELRKPRSRSTNGSAAEHGWIRRVSRT